MKSEPKIVALLDMHAILHRGYHALPNFLSPDGEPTGALYGFLTFLLKLVRDINPDYVAACFDLPGGTFRHETYKEYKAGRGEIDAALVAQLIRAHDLVKGFGIPEYSVPGFEADDMLGTIVEKEKDALKKGEVKIVIASGDMDTLQLVDGKKVVVYTLKKGINDTMVYDEAAVKERYGFGPELMPDYKGLRGDPSDNIIGIAGIGEKTATDLLVNFGSIEKMYATLKKHPEKFKEAGIKDRIVKLLTEGEDEALFSKTLASIRRDAPIEFKLPAETWRKSFDMERAKEICRTLGFRSLIARLDEISQTISVPEKEPEPEFPEVDTTTDLFKKAALAFSILDSSNNAPTPAEIFEKTKTKDLEDALTKLEEKIVADDLTRVYREIELPLLPVAEAMEKRGVMIDKKYLADLSKTYHTELSRLEKKIWEYAGGEFNINSPKQLGEVLFEKMQLTAKGLKKTSGGARSTRVSELEKLVGVHPIVDEIMQYREYQKLLSTYIDTLPSLADAQDRIHTTFLQVGTTTGRMSSINPNLQNIPIKTELGKNIRKAFVATPGYVLLACDYSQIDLRAAALLSGDKKLTEAFANGEDIHMKVAMEVFGVSSEEVTADMRRQAKVLNFGILYGMGTSALKQNLGTTKEEAERFHDAYFQRFSGVQEYVNRVGYEAEKNGFTTTYFGRRRYFPELKSTIPYIKSAGLRMAVNAPIQGTSADVMKLAMIGIAEKIKEKKWEGDAHMLLQVHDEVVLEVLEEKVEDAAREIKTVMEHAISGPIPFTVKVSSGRSWGDLSELDLK
jgi:DNA polymerase-1